MQLLLKLIKQKNILNNCKYPIVVKASGLAAGKGVIICQDKLEANKAIDDIMVDKIFKDAGNEVYYRRISRRGRSFNFIYYDSNIIVPFISAKDHKKIGEKETGLNTGGMGTIAPNPYVTKSVYENFITDIMNPTLEGIKKEKMDFAGFIFFGLMITEKGVYLLEYNMRLGDPETQVVLPLLESDFIDILNSAMDKN